MLQEEAEKIKNQIVAHIDSTFPEGKKEAAKSQILSMNNEQLAEFLEKNNMAGSSQGQKCIFCSIASGEIESVILEENGEAVAALEINPISDGHAIIIPKKHVSSEKELSAEIIKFANKIASKLKKLSPKKIDVIPSNMFGHEILNVLPVYRDEDMNSERKPAKKEDLEMLKENLKEAPKPKIVKKSKTKKIKEKLWLPRRIP